MEAPPRIAPWAPPEQWNDWRWQMRRAARSVEALQARLTLTEAERLGAERAVAEGFPLSVTPHYLSLCDPDDPACPIRRQCVPHAAEAERVEGDLRDPLGEEAHEVAPRLVRRYPDRALLLATDRCSVYCRFCTRSRWVGDGGGAASLARLQPALDWLEAHPEVVEVIVSGGDPLVQATERIAALLERLSAIEHIEVVRIATRTPVTLPQRIDEALCRALRSARPAVWVMTHFNHPRESCEASARALALLADHGLPVMNQTVLLRGVNDEPETLARLFRGLLRHRVRPYYLLQADPVAGTGHLRTPLEVGLRIVERLQGRLSGIAMPRFVVDTPGGLGKVVVQPDPVVARAPGRTTLRTWRGACVDYVDPPAAAPQGSRVNSPP